jgi:8-amino-7-oxononanoate synthase
MHIATELSAQLNQLQQQNLLRKRRVFQPGAQQYSFAGNDYLGLSQHPLVLKAYADGLQLWGAGSGASPVVSGFQPPHAYLCRQLAEWLGRDDALLFSSGFAANHCTMRSLAPMYSRVVVDKLSHASLLDGMTDATNSWKRFRHNNVQHAQQLLPAEGASLLVSESVFSMDGDQAPLKALADLAAQATADLWIDDAHGLGVVGAEGCSAAGQLTQRQLPVLTATFGKGLGVMGAAIVGSSDLIAYLHTRGREYIYSTAFSGAQAAAVSTAIGLAQGHEGQRLRARLADNIEDFRSTCAQNNIMLAPSEHAIQIVPVGSEQVALTIGTLLAEQGIVVGVIRPPTVAKGSARLRITLSAQHAKEDIQRLIQALSQALTQALVQEK